nr:zinc finger, CCHC-type [Tanacetum cinerariifolium]
ERVNIFSKGMWAVDKCFPNIPTKQRSRPNGLSGVSMMAPNVFDFNQQKAKERMISTTPNKRTRTSKVDGFQEAKLGICPRNLRDSRSRPTDTFESRPGAASISAHSFTPKPEQESKNMRAVNTIDVREEYTAGGPTNAKPVRGPRSGPMVAARFSTVQAPASNDRELPNTTSKNGGPVGPTNHKRTLSVSSSSPPVTQRADQRPQKISRSARRTNVVPVVPSNDDIPSLDFDTENGSGFMKRVSINSPSSTSSKIKESGGTKFRQNVQKVSNLVPSTKKKKLVNGNDRKKDGVLLPLGPVVCSQFWRLCLPQNLTLIVLGHTALSENPFGFDFRRSGVGPFYGYGKKSAREFRNEPVCSISDYQTMSMDNRLLMEIQSSGLSPELTVSNKTSVLDKLLKTTTEAKALQEKESKQDSVGKHMVLAYQKYMAPGVKSAGQSSFTDNESGQHCPQLIPFGATISNGAKGKRSISSVPNVEDDEPPLVFSHLEIPEMDVLRDAFGEQSLDVGSWLNIDDTILHDDEFIEAVWDALKTRHIGEERVQQARLQTLKSDFEMLHMKEDETIDTFTRKLTTLVNKAASLGHTIEDQTLVRKLLNAILDRYLQIVTSIDQYSGLSEMTLEEAIGRLKTYDERIKYKRGKQVDNQKKLMFTRHENKGKYFRERGRGKHRFSQGINHEIFKVERKDEETSHKNYNRNNFKKSSYDTSKLQCYKCKKIGHIAPNCPQRTKPNEQSNLVEENLEPTLLMAILEDSNEEKHVKEVEEKKVLLHEEDVGYKETNMDSLWYLDNGASNHMTGVREHFKELDENVSGKVDDRNSRMVYLGNEQGSKAYRLFDPTAQRICVSRDVKFKENETWDWKEYMSEHINDEPEWTDIKIGNLEITNEHHDQGIQPIKEDNEFPNNNDDDYASPTRDSTSHSQTTHTPSTRLSQVNSQVTPNILT